MNLAALIGLLAVAWVVYTFNRLTRLRQLGDNAWSDIDVQLKRRHDLIPNVVAVVQGHAGYERGTLEALVAARGRALQAQGDGPATRARQEDPLAGALQRVIAVAEAYPELKAAASFAGLQTTLTDVEDHLQNARRYYNAVVRDFNTAIAQFPAGIIAGTMRLHPREFFGLDDPSERAVPRVPLVLLIIGLSAAGGARGALHAQQKSYSIERFDARIRVNRDASIDVTETITARFVGSWNGLYRTIPVEYRTAQGLNWTLGVSLQSAQDDAGRSLRTETSRQGHYIKYKIWIPGAVNATRTLVLRYHATNGLRFFDEHDELYWNVTGDEWEVPIQAATAEAELPPGTTGMRAIAFNGVYGATAQDARIQINGDIVRIAMPHALGYHEGLTAVVGWDKGVVTAPTAADRALATVSSNWPLLIPIPVFLLAFYSWRRRGRDPRRRPIAVQYEPPPKMTPAEAGTLLDNSADMRDITATLVDLAVRGQLRIEEHQNPKLLGLFGGGVQYTLHRLTQGESLAAHESRVFGGIFDGRGESVELSALKDEFYKELPPIRDAIFDELTGSGFYRDRPDKVRQKWMGIAVAVALLIGVGGTYLSKLTLLTPVPFVIAAVVAAIIVVIFAQIMPARTEAGTRALEQVLGFEEFLRRVEAEHLKRIIIGHPELFDKYLPYAMAFGVEQQFARAFEGIYTEAPRWYVGPSMMNFNVGHFTSSMSHLSTAAGTTLSSSPRSSSGSGFGGGGGSGGGGGGGGGGAF
ncbi:MAG TPA: LemA family protein [Gemmatimonadales bacterium]|nr:LemA family protein [Gemmatimonadales bacterium]